MEKVTRAAALYYLIQGVAVAGWWLVLVLRPEVRGFFQLEADSQVSLLAFLIPDAIFLAAGSLAAALLILIRNRYSTVAMWLVTGAISYAWAYTFSFVAMTDVGWLGVIMMSPAMIWSGIFATGMTVGDGMFRQSKKSSTGYVIFKTFAQIVVVWGIILFVFPFLITIVEDKVGIPRLGFPFQRVIAAFLFVLMSSIGIYAAIVMSRFGKGTPLPLDHAAELVFLGPYAWVRNPMAVSGIGQGLAMALFLGSPLVAVYALMGSAIWQFVFRPLEEDDLFKRFGEPFDLYRREVKCWLPRSRPYSVEKRDVV